VLKSWALHYGKNRYKLPPALICRDYPRSLSDGYDFTGLIVKKHYHHEDTNRLLVAAYPKKAVKPGINTDLCR